jgi:hypothetical protein
MSWLDLKKEWQRVVIGRNVFLSELQPDGNVSIPHFPSNNIVLTHQSLRSIQTAGVIALISDLTHVRAYGRARVV